MSEVTAKITAAGKHQGESVIIECIEYDGDDDNKRHVVLLKNGIEDLRTNFLFEEYVGIRYAEGAKVPQAYNPPKNSAAAYWLAMKKYFDELPKTTTEGEVIPVEYGKDKLKHICF